MDNITLKEQFATELLNELRNNIMPYWLNMMQDPEGGWLGRRDGEDNPHPEAPRGAILNARILWSMAAAFRLTGEQQYLEAARRAKREIADRFFDREFGGIYWSIAPDGTPLDTKKQFYAIGFAIYGLSELARADSSDTEALELAKRLFSDIETHSRDREHGGYLEATTRSWGPIADMRLSDKDDNASKTMNTHLHIIEPYTNLLRVWRSPELLEATRSLLELFLNRIADPAGSGHLGLFFDNEWNRRDGIISYGHDIEASWLLLETAMVIGDPDLTARTLKATRRIADAALQGACCDGSMVYERHADGSYDNEKHWWVQAESVIGQLYLWRFHGREEMLGSARRTWDYIRRFIVDSEGGEWLWSRLPDGSPNRHDDKAGFWKCPYHNSRMCIEAVERLRD